MYSLTEILLFLAAGAALARTAVAWWKRGRRPELDDVDLFI